MFPPANPANQPTDQSPTAKAPLAVGGEVQNAPQKDWTVAVLLAESQPPDAANKLGAGVDHQLPILKALAKETEGKSVNLLVHAERPADDGMHPCIDGGDIARQAACVLDATDHNRAITERYLIHDGKIETLPAVQFTDGAQDLAGLVRDSGQLAPAHKLGLVIASHGGGSEGIFTNRGQVKPEQISKSIQYGLKWTNNQKLDLLDYDACDMGQMVIVDAGKDVAKNIVASSAVEGLTYTNDAQNLSALMRGLMADTSVGGKALGESIVAQARNGADGHGDNNAIHTLANFELTGMDDLKQNLDRFGAALTKSAKNPANLHAIQIDVDKAPVPDTGKYDYASHNRDLRSFTEDVLTDCQAHKITGDTRQLEAAAKNLLHSMDQVVTAKYGEKAKGVERFGGVSVSMSGSEILDSKVVAHELTPVHAIKNALTEVIASNPPLSFKDRVMPFIDSHIKDLPADLMQHYPAEARALRDGRDALAKAQTLPAYTVALKHMLDITTRVDNGPLGKNLEEMEGRNASDEQLRYLNAPLDKVTPEWDNFVGLLQEQTK